VLHEAARQCYSASGKVQRFVAGVRAHQNCATVFAQPFESGAEPDETLTVKPRCRFVEQEQPWSMQKCARDR